MAVIEDNGDAWIEFQELVAGVNTTTGLARAVVSVSGTSFTGKGRHYKLTDNTTQGFTVSGMLQDTTALQTTLVPRSARVAVFNLALTETCVTGSTVMNGIGRLNEAKSAFSLMYTSTDSAKCGLLFLQR